MRCLRRILKVFLQDRLTTNIEKLKKWSNNVAFDCSDRCKNGRTQALTSTALDKLVDPLKNPDLYAQTLWEMNIADQGRFAYQTLGFSTEVSVIDRKEWKNVVKSSGSINTYSSVLVIKSLATNRQLRVKKRRRDTFKPPSDDKNIANSISTSQCSHLFWIITHKFCKNNV